MSLLDSLLKQGIGAQSDAGGLGNLLAMASSNPQVISALAGLLRTRDASTGSNGGLAGLGRAFQSKGLGDIVSGWISTGPNPPVSAAQITDVLGHQTVQQFAGKAGLPVTEAGSFLATLLPAAIDHLTPDGTIPESSALEGSL